VAGVAPAEQDLSKVNASHSYTSCGETDKNFGVFPDPGGRIIRISYPRFSYSTLADRPCPVLPGWGVSGELYI